MRDRPASSFRSGLGLTSRIHTRPWSSSRRSTRPYPLPCITRHAASATRPSLSASFCGMLAGQTGTLPKSSGEPVSHLPA
ncbi:MAG: hypothetical protein AUH07_06840 [Gemmatimonadetes bacterium 13_2_20CM_70_9]|nr:MAG: hypothetical protein AUH07_06840 [Gemmatimonadetes bacterium 13_2_20CM_70_9]